MRTVTVVSASPYPLSKVDWLANRVLVLLDQCGIDGRHVRVRDLPPAALISADVAVPDVADAVRITCAADGIVLVTPIYQASYSGLLKVFLDLLPRFAFRGKAVLPLSVAGSAAHVLALDYALRPVIQSLAPWHVVSSYCVLADQLLVTDGTVTIDPTTERALTTALDGFRQALHATTRRDPAWTSA